MSIDTTHKPAPSRLNFLTAAQLPKFTPLATLVVSVAAAAGALALFGSASIANVVIFGALLFLVAIFTLSASVEGSRRAKDRLARYVVTGFFLLALTPLISLVWGTVANGISRFDGTFFTWSMRNILGEGGGAVHAIWGTLIITGIATLISVPIGLLTAIYLVEYGSASKLGAGIRFFVDVMTGIPSIVAGLFAYTMFSMIFGAGHKSGLSGAVALTILMIPTVVRSTEEMLRIVPNELREASYALGVPKFRTILKVVLPTSIAGIITGVVLAIARVIGETAPLLVTASFTASMNLDPTQNPMATLPVFVYNQYMYAPGIDTAAYHARAWAGALTLILIVMGLNALGRFIAWKFAPKPGR
ncbi:phosphate ABC transporter permease PstA [Tessaracoccus flavus]|uniref:Phosphate transport system permease protein PstA n=1 Tax=Tessaracoccus flavus TaxID=1610493 RepID=A0A1Q2CC60_9ACTN|nr:phosphate ABC transporter permease PstA [Tessaracoccus flavus]AQP43692.1 phosphate ABC transporter, permease protein PstA [Tessaracoccus flavus]SDZ02840.1 phosphate ABC transporter membrane protein 2, PhoT family [Tessaracoccus flavus]